MPETLFIKPTAGRRVMDPATRQPLPADGLLLATDSPHATYWHRRIADGDVVATQPAPAQTTKTAIKIATRSPQ